jgi:hypothetical protein
LNEWLGAPSDEALQVFGCEPSVLGDARQHSRADFLALVECEDEVLPAFSRKRSMRAGLPLKLPTRS